MEHASRLTEIKKEPKTTILDSKAARDDQVQEIFPDYEGVAGSIRYRIGNKIIQLKPEQLPPRGRPVPVRKPIGKNNPNPTPHRPKPTRKAPTKK